MSRTGRDWHCGVCGASFSDGRALVKHQGWAHKGYGSGGMYGPDLGRDLEMEDRLKRAVDQVATTYNRCPAGAGVPGGVIAGKLADAYRRLLEVENLCAQGYTLADRDRMDELLLDALGALARVEAWLLEGAKGS